MSRPFCSHVAMLQDGASSGVLFVNKLALPLVDFKMNVIKWKLHCNKVEIARRAILARNQTCDYKSHSRFAVVRFCNHAFDFRPNCTPLTAITIINQAT